VGRHVPGSRLALRVSLLAAALATGCLQTTISGDTRFSNAGTSAGSSAGSSGGTTQGIVSSGGSSASSAASTSAGATSGGSSGTSGGTTGGDTTTITDAGYAFCLSPNDADGGPAEWLCDPGTYFCEFNELGKCAQCRSDSDCANQAFPTYDPSRPRCDLHSGVFGYQGYCQECLDNADCAGNPAGLLCNLDSSFAQSFYGQPIAAIGFEACGKLQADCRLDGGPRCAVGEACDQDSGQCDYPSGYCSTDRDCVGVFSMAPYLLEPYCGATISSTVLPDGGFLYGQCSSCQGKCPHGNCNSDADCPFISSDSSRLSCEFSWGTGLCSCTDSSQCSGFWPVCEGLDGGFVNGVGQPIGTCGCDSDDQCAAAGLVCVPQSDDVNEQEYYGSYCGEPCTAPGFPSCSSYSSILENEPWDDPFSPICDSTSGFCEPCASDQQCQAEPQSGGPTCLSGACTCATDADCAGGWSCRPGYPGLTCAPSLPECTPGSCSPYFCDWDSGDCTNAFSCLEDFDCQSSSYSDQPFCDSSGYCVQCRDNRDCVVIGEAAQGSSHCCPPGDSSCNYPGFCAATCGADQDCLGNSSGSVCLGDAGCGCGSDAECAGNIWGSTCVTDPTNALHGQCACTGLADCDAGQSCLLDDAGWGHCGSGCVADGDCPSQYFCEPSGGCRPRCDEGHRCLGSEPACDLAAGSDSGVVWCVECLSASDCPAVEGCFDDYCGECYHDPDCRPNEACLQVGNSRVCQPRCDAGACPNGEVCDTLNLAYNGADICYPCVTAADCPDTRGCNGATHLCGSCDNTYGVYDCLPGDVCSTYWEGEVSGTCLQSCDLKSCPASEPICGVLPSLTTLHKYCFGCLRDSDCASLGVGAWCDVSINQTFTCQPPPL